MNWETILSNRPHKFHAGSFAILKAIFIEFSVKITFLV
jgi:hypothetical protein